MTTIIYGCPSEDAFTPRQATLLANLFQEPEWVTDGELQEIWNDKLIITTTEKSDITGFAEENLVPYQDALALIAGEPENASASVMSITDAIDLTALLIENDLCSDETPEHIKTDLRVLAVVFSHIQRMYPFSKSPDATPDMRHRKHAAKTAIRDFQNAMKGLLMSIQFGKYHATRTEQSREQQ